MREKRRKEEERKEREKTEIALAVKTIYFRPGAVLMPVIPAVWEVRAGRSLEVRSSRTACQQDETLSTKNTKISPAWWQAPVIPATQEAEAKESLEPGRQRLQ